MVDNRGGLGTDRTYTLRAFVDGETPAIDTVESATVKLQREYTTPQPGATVTDQVVLTPDGQAGSIVQLGLVDYPVADLEVCFPWRKVPAGARYIVINRIDAAGERAAPSYGAWQVPP
jgi:hypothetical protein